MEPIHYDAFISYRHVHPDMDIAESLHKKLERYHIPSKIQKITGKKRIERIFRDKEELPLSSDLSGNIYEALDHSDFLIVICSPEALESRWVQAEIEYFISVHSRKRVLTVLTKGEPEESFPQILLEDVREIKEPDGSTRLEYYPVEPLAADIRGENLKEQLKKLDSEVLRILAPILGVKYDDLKQRHREHRLKVALASLSVISLLLFSFTVYAFDQANRINEQYQLARRNQALNLSVIANQEKARGERIAALQSVLEVFGEDEIPAKPLIPQQSYALNNALYSYYHISAADSFRPDYTFYLEAGTTATGAFNNSGTIYLSVDVNGNAYFIDTNTYKPIWKTSIFKETGELYEIFIDGFFIDDNLAVLCSANYFYKVNIQNREFEEIIENPSSNPYESRLTKTCDNELFAYCDIFSDIWLIDFENGKSEKINVTFPNISEELTEDGFDYGKRITALAFSPDRKLLAVGTADIPSITSEPKQRDHEIVLYSLEEKKQTSSITTQSIGWMQFLNNQDIAVVEYEIPSPAYSFEYYLRNFKAAIYTMESNEPVWKSQVKEKSTYQDYIKGGIYIIEPYGRKDSLIDQAIAFCIMDSLILFDSENDTVLTELDFPANILDANQLGNYMFLTLEDGSVYSLNAEYPSRIFSIDSGLKSSVSNNNSNLIAQNVTDSNRIVFSRYEIDEAITETVEELPDLPYTFLLQNDVYSSDDRYRATFFGSLIQIIDRENDSVLLEIPTNLSRKVNDSASGSYPLMCFINNNQDLFVFYDREGVEIWNLENKQMSYRDSFEISPVSRNFISTNAKGTMVAVGSSSGTISISPIDGILQRQLSIFTIEESATPVLYANVPYGFADLEEEEIYIYDSPNSIYYKTPFYSFEELVRKARLLIEQSNQEEISDNIEPIQSENSSLQESQEITEEEQSTEESSQYNTNLSDQFNLTESIEGNFGLTVEESAVYEGIEYTLKNIAFQKGEEGINEIIAYIEISNQRDYRLQFYASNIKLKTPADELYSPDYMQKDDLDYSILLLPGISVEGEVTYKIPEEVDQFSLEVYLSSGSAEPVASFDISLSQLSEYEDEEKIIQSFNGHFDPESTLEVNEGIEADNKAIYTLEEVRYEDSAPYYGRDEDYRYLLVKVKVENTGYTPVTYISSDWAVLTEDGQYLATDYTSLGYELKELGYGQLGYEESDEGWLQFRVPRNRKLYLEVFAQSSYKEISEQEAIRWSIPD